jgi:uncharacterized protein (UPF0276 family)
VIAARAQDAPFLGVGVGLRPRHFARVLEQVRERVPVVLHGVSLNIGSADPLDADYLAELAALAQRYEPAWLSDHLSWTGVRGRNLHDLLPLPYTEEVLAHVCERVSRVQDRLGRRIALENPSSYFAWCADAIPEPEFLALVAERADCGILLDVNNVFVSAHNHGFAAESYLARIPGERVFQIHLAGHSRQRKLLIDTHDHPVCDEVWALYERAVRRLGPVSTLIEWDERIPELEVLTAEAARARGILARVSEQEMMNGARCTAGTALAAHHRA